jgi:hypothetical protein
MLIFTFPYLLFSIFGMFPEKISKRFTSVIIITLMLFNVFTLIVDRQHYRVLYQTRHLQFLKDISQLPEKSKATILIANHVEINNFYQKKYKWDFAYTNYLVGVSNKLGLKEVQKIVNLSKKPYFIYGGMSIANPEIVQIIKKKYPVCILKKDYYASNLYLFSKEIRKDTLNPYFLEENKFNEEKNNWSNVDLIYLKKGAELNAAKEWGPSYSINLKDVLKHRNDVIDVVVEFDSEFDLELVSVLKYKDSVLNYSAISSSYFEADRN